MKRYKEHRGIIWLERWIGKGDIVSYTITGPDERNFLYRKVLYIGKVD